MTTVDVRATLGDYDPATFVDLDPATYPPLPPGASLYQPGMSWTSTGTGVVSGHPAAPGDLIYAVARLRLFGELTYDAGVYGSTVGPNDWSPIDTGFVVWNSDTPGHLQPPFPFDGCPFTRSDLPGGDWAPGWRIVIDAYYLRDDRSRVYGADLFGDMSYGGEVHYGYQWVDITQPSFAVRAFTGTRDGGPVVDVDTIELELADPDGTWADFVAPELWFRPFVGAALRVGFLDPSSSYHPLFVGEVELIGDVHDGERPRTVTFQAFGHVMDTVVDLLGWQRTAETASVRFAALTAAAGWRWGTGAVTFPHDAALRADTGPRDVVARDELDRTAISVGATFDVDRWGEPRVREWPLTPTGDTLNVVDCRTWDAPADAVISHEIDYVADQAQLLNEATVTNNATPPDEAVAVDEPSQMIYGRRGRAFGFPRTGLAYADHATAQALVDRLIDRNAYVIRRAARVAADTRVDPQWLAALTRIDTGQPVHVTRFGIRRYDLDAVVVGVDHVITPGRIESAIHLGTITPTH
jgi:hypothetical protein